MGEKNGWWKDIYWCLKVLPLHGKCKQTWSPPWIRLPHSHLLTYTRQPCDVIGKKSGYRCLLWSSVERSRHRRLTYHRRLRRDLHPIPLVWTSFPSSHINSKDDLERFWKLFLLTYLLHNWTHDRGRGPRRPLRLWRNRRHRKEFCLVS